jgi:hypothetical protein
LILFPLTQNKPLQPETRWFVCNRTSDHDVLYLLAVELRGVAKRIGIALSDQFRRDTLNTRTLVVGAGAEVVEFRSLIAL